MATQVRRMSVPMTVQNQSSGGIFTQLMRLIIQPRTFFKAMPSNHQWLLVAILVLVITGFTATTQIQSSSTSSTSTTSTQSTAFSLSTLSQTSTNSTTQTIQPSAAATTTANSGSTGTNANTTNNAAAATASTSSSTIFMNALLAACGVIAVWGGEAVLLSLVCMLRGYAPKISKSLQIAVWASLPLALMLVLRYAYYANGGTGGSLGLSLLLDSWRGYTSLPQLAQRAIAVFTSNLTLFWVWNIVLLYFGARYALGGRRLMSVFVVIMWIIASTLIPAYAGQPNTRTAPRPTTTQTTTTGTTNTTRTTGTTATTTAQGATGATTQGGGFGGFGGNGGGPGGAPPGG